MLKQSETSNSHSYICPIYMIISDQLKSVHLTESLVKLKEFNQNFLKKDITFTILINIDENSFLSFLLFLCEFFKYVTKIVLDSEENAIFYSRE